MKKRRRRCYEESKEICSQRKKTKGKLHSIQTKISALVVFVVVAAVAVTILIMVSYVKDLVIDSAYGKMLNMATSYGKLIDKEEENINDGIKQYTSLTTEQFTTILGKPNRNTALC